MGAKISGVVRDCGSASTLVLIGVVSLTMESCGTSMVGDVDLSTSLEPWSKGSSTLSFSFKRLERLTLLDPFLLNDIAR